MTSTNSTMDARILTLHPQGKKGVNILRVKYDEVRQVLQEVMKKNGGEMTFEALSDQAIEVLEQNNFQGKPLWYIVTVKLDMEARGVLERIPKTSPHRLKWISTAEA